MTTKTTVPSLPSSSSSLSLTLTTRRRQQRRRRRRQGIINKKLHSSKMNIIIWISTIIMIVLLLSLLLTTTKNQNAFITTTTTTTEKTVVVVVGAAAASAVVDAAAATTAAADATTTTSGGNNKKQYRHRLSQHEQVISRYGDVFQLNIKDDDNKKEETMNTNTTNGTVVKGDIDNEDDRAATTAAAKKKREEQKEILNILGGDDKRAAAHLVMEKIGMSMEDRLVDIFDKAKSVECRAKIATHLGYFIKAMSMDRALPFSNFKLKNTCNETKYDFDNLPMNTSIGEIQGREYRPDPYVGDDPSGGYIVDWKELKLLYVILTHDAPQSTIRLVDSLTVLDCALCTQFVIHVDAKSDYVYKELEEYYSNNVLVHLVPNNLRVRVNWGGFSMVNATLQALKYAFAIDLPDHYPMQFDKVVHMASTSYPLKSNTEIRRTIAAYPLDANMFHVVFKPTNPSPGSWYYFVECDDWVHRIYRLPPITSTPDENGVEIYTASQWWISSREFAFYLAEAKPGSFVSEYLDYIQHVVVADEAFFGTVLRHTSPFCNKHHNNNFLHLQFDRWENEIKVEERDERKCLMPRKDHCGRSPTTMTLDYLPMLELAPDLFARKFDDAIDEQIKDVIDLNRERDEEKFKREEAKEHGDEVYHDDEDSGKKKKERLQQQQQQQFDPKFEGHGVLIVAKDTLYDEEPLCLGLGETKNKVRLVPCFLEWVVETLAQGWEHGAVIIEETQVNLHSRWELGPCSTDGYLRRLSNGTMEMTPGKYSPTGPRCILRQMDGLRQGRCMDGESDRVQPGGEVQVFPCRGRWHQFWSFGGGGGDESDESEGNDGVVVAGGGGGVVAAPIGSMHTSVPRHLLKRIHDSGKEQAPYLCLAVSGRGLKDEEDWVEDNNNSASSSTSSASAATSATDEQEEEEEEDEEEEEEDGEADEKIATEKEKEDGDEEEMKKKNDVVDDESSSSSLHHIEFAPLAEWKNEQVVTTRCDNEGAVIEFVYIPFIVEDDEGSSGGGSGGEEVLQHAPSTSSSGIQDEDGYYGIGAGGGEAPAVDGTVMAGPAADGRLLKKNEGEDEEEEEEDEDEL